MLSLLAAGLAVLVGLAGCGQGGDDATSSGGGFDGDRGNVAEAPQANPGAAAPAQDKAGQPAGAPARFRVDERSIIYTGTLSVRLTRDDDIDEVANQAIAAASGAGGFVGSDRRTSDNGRSQATLELRVPADRFTAVVDRLAGFGTEESRSIDTQDVTEEVVDLDARIASQLASVNRTRTLLAQAQTIAEIVSVEGELAKRESELASLQAKKRRLADLTSLSTITLTLLGFEAEVVEETETGFLPGLDAGFRSVVVALEIALTILGALLPWLVALGVPIYVLVRFLRWLSRRRRPAAQATVPAPVGPSPPPAA
jgi:hypothetical protein